jgi:hypothetical protein
MHGAVCHEVVHGVRPKTSLDGERINKNIKKQYVVFVFQAGMWLAKASIALLIKPHHLLGENHV